MLHANNLATAILFCVLLAAVLFCAIWSGTRQAKGLHVLPHLPNFPIDAVCLWVDGNDTSWRKSAREYFHYERTHNPSFTQVHDAAREPTRVPSTGRDELFYNVVGIIKYMPWVRRYFLVTQRPHKPAWWPASGRMAGIQFVLVHHDEIFEDTTLLPNFSGLTIQKYLGNIRGLAEHFILFDDDMFVARPLLPHHFFAPNGTPVLNAKPAIVDRYPNGNWKFQMMNLQERMRDELNDPNFRVHVTEHVCVPLLKTMFKYAAGPFTQTCQGFKRFRTFKEFPVHYAAVNLHVARKQILPQRPEVETSFSFGGGLKLHNGLLPHMFCINDFLTAADRKIMDDWYLVR